MPAYRKRVERRAPEPPDRIARFVVDDWLDRDELAAFDRGERHPDEGMPLNPAFAKWLNVATRRYQDAVKVWEEETGGTVPDAALSAYRIRLGVDPVRTG